MSKKKHTLVAVRILTDDAEWLRRQADFEDCSVTALMKQAVRKLRAEKQAEQAAA